MLQSKNEVKKMFNKNFGINNANHLTMSGVDVCDIANKYQTPLYLMDENLIRENCRIYKKALEENYENGLVLYASKAFSCLYMYKLIKEEGLGIDVVSGGELYTALSAEFPAEKIYFHGNNKTKDELLYAISNNIGRIVVDNQYELENIEKIAADMNKTVSVLFRIKPGIDAHTHVAIMTGQIDSKFGFAIENSEVYDIIEKALKCPHIKISGLHCHIGSQIFEVTPFIEAAEVMLNLICSIKNKYDIEIDELNLGGGFGIKYIEEDDPVDYGEYIRCVADKINSICSKENIKKPKILMEPGRSIVGEAGITLYTVGAVKDIKNVRKYVSIDGGLGDNPRYALYEAEYSVCLPEKMDALPCEKVTIAGKCCESGDIIAKDIEVPKINVGDLLCVFSTGAYNYSMASNYNRIPRLPVIMIKDGADKLIIRRETYEDIIKNDIL